MNKYIPRLNLLQRQQQQQYHFGCCNHITTTLSSIATTTRVENILYRTFVTSTVNLTPQLQQQQEQLQQQQEIKKKKERVVVLGTGWGGFNLALHINQKDIDLTIISPRNHFVFTPLLPSAAVGTLELRCIQEPIRSILQSNTGSNYIQAKALAINSIDQTILCESVQNHTNDQYDDTFTVPYDKLVISIGVKTNTFGIQSIQDNVHDYRHYNANANANTVTSTTRTSVGTGTGTDIGNYNYDEKHCIFYLKQLAHARAIRANIIDCFERASLPTISIEEKYRLLSFIIVGGGPTSCEFTAELHDFVKQDVQKLYPALYPYVKITLVEAGPVLLGPFDKALQEYAYVLFQKRDIDIKLGTAVVGVEDYTPTNYRFHGKRAIMSNGTFVEFGTMIWSAGLAPRTFIENLQSNYTTTSSSSTTTTTTTSTQPKFLLHPRSKRLLVDDCLRVKGHENTIWAMGDCAVNESGVPLPQLAQVARQQGMYLAKILSNKKSSDIPFQFFSLGSMAFLGELKGIYDGTTAGPLRDNTDVAKMNDMSITGMILAKVPSIKGLAALLLWRFAYWGRQTSIANKILIPVHWFKTFFFGRDTSRY